ncbi:MAG: patatin-like phospholipase family protein [Phenylobacterium sp.]|uniref:patatin-like phospholipase family protein n=1 Tax=Phenylobacterium sp. TaxID=1871053 RepID=UPI0027195E0C|nr:patatin-like phospholipase family protein [Phenylobacterium sp.]MDO8411580.1 patatin-like phospholipase family protein [Phenylobacterium sp.]
MRPRKGATWMILAATFGLVACGSISRPSADLVELSASPAPTPLDAFRFIATDPVGSTAFLESWRAQRDPESDGVNVLAVSGGGANGAFGAGLLVGWSEAGGRPAFDIVTGVSTGALMAPFAYLGPEWDDQLMRAYTDPDAARLTEGQWGLLRRPSLYSDRSLRALVGKYVDSPLLRAIAVEHRAGRRLLMATTNLDAQEEVIWDMGAIALAGQAPGQAPAALALFRNVMVASASIPGVFPPVMMDPGSVDDLAEMHVDGGVTTPFVLAPATMSFWEPKGALAPADLYVIINGEIEARRTITKGATLPILMRSFDTMSKADLRAHLLASVAFAERNGATLRYAAIPTELGADSLAFDTESRGRLFAAGRAAGLAGTAFREAIPEEISPPAGRP